MIFTELLAKEKQVTNKIMTLNKILVELSTVNFSGTFLGTLIQNRMVGKWISSSQKKNYTFEWTEIIATKQELYHFQKAITEKGNKFRNY